MRRPLIVEPQCCTIRAWCCIPRPGWDIGSRVADERKEGRESFPALFREERSPARYSSIWRTRSRAGPQLLRDATAACDRIGGAQASKARGWDGAFGPGVVAGQISQSGRGERDCPATTDLPVTMRLAEPPEPFDWLRSA